MMKKRKQYYIEVMITHIYLLSFCTVTIVFYTFVWLFNLITLLLRDVSRLDSPLRFHKVAVTEYGD